MKLLLDTHIALWAISDSKRLSEDERALLEDEENAIYFSMASVSFQEQVCKMRYNVSLNRRIFS